MTAPTMQTVMDLIDGRTDELVALTQDLIRFPTVNLPGEAYRPCAEYIGERLKKRGFTVEYVRGEGSPGDSDQYPRTNVIARWTGSEPGPCVHFNSHIDVVEVGSGWTVDPFGGEVKDGRVYGRGACDMKGGLAASIIAVEALIDSGLPCRARWKSPARWTRSPAATAASPIWPSAAGSRSPASTTSSSPSR